MVHELKSRDHPRMCGEKSSKSLIRNAGEGSPPHVRGKGSTSLTALLKKRITPACAGKRKT